MPKSFNKQMPSNKLATGKQIYRAFYGAYKVSL